MNLQPREPFCGFILLAIPYDIITAVFFSLVNAVIFSSGNITF